MKRTDTLTKLIAALLFLAFLCYAAVALVRAMQDTVVTAEAVAAEISRGGMASGIVLREETVLTSGEPYVDVTAAEGSRVAVGAPLATAMRSEQGLARAARMHQLELEIRQTKAALQKLDSAEDLTGRDETLRAAVAEINAAVARHEPAGLSSGAMTVHSLLFADGGAAVSAAELAAMEQELQSLRSSTTGDASVLSAASAGVFSATVDGYEALTPALLDKLTVSDLEYYISNGRESYPGAYGKLVTGIYWYFAAVMNEEDAADLSVGENVTLNFGRWYGTDVTAQVLSVGTADGGRVPAVFRCEAALSETLGMRRVNAEVTLKTVSGIRVPAPAVHTEEDSGETWVWVSTAMQLERKRITILWQDEDQIIADFDPDPDALRVGNTVVVSGSDLYEGKILK